MKCRDVARGIDIRGAGATELVHHDAAFQTQPGRVRQCEIALHADTGHHHVSRIVTAVAADHAPRILDRIDNDAEMQCYSGVRCSDSTIGSAFGRNAAAHGARQRLEYRHVGTARPR